MTTMENRDIADRLGVHTTTVSRWRIGARVPDREMMVVIERELSWPVEEQMRAFQQESYAPEFRQFLERRFRIPDNNDKQEV